MVRRYDEVLDDISRADNYDLIEHIRDYVEKNSYDYSPLEYDNLTEAVADKLDEYDPSNCLRISEITLEFKPVPSAPDTRNTMRFNKDKAISLCERAHQLDGGLPDWIKQLYPQAVTWYIKLEGAPPQVSELTKRLEKIVPSLTKKIQQLEEGIPKINVEASLEAMKRYQALEQDVESSLANMDKRLREVERGKVVPVPSIPQPPSEYTVSMTVTELNKFRQLMSSKFPGRFYGIQSEKGSNTISIPYSSDADYDAIKELVEQAKETVKRIPIPIIRPSGYTDILNILCRTFERETGKSCGLSRNGALSTLASRIGHYVQELGIDWQQLDIGSISLDAKPGQTVYRAEQADETYNRIVAQTSMKTAGQLEREAEAMLCEDQVIYPTFLDVYVLYEVQNHRALTQNEKQELTDKLKILHDCGYRDSQFAQYKDSAQGWFENQHVPWDILVEQEIRDRLK